MSKKYEMICEKNQNNLVLNFSFFLKSSLKIFVFLVFIFFISSFIINFDLFIIHKLIIFYNSLIILFSYVYVIFLILFNFSIFLKNCKLKYFLKILFKRYWLDLLSISILILTLIYLLFFKLNDIGTGRFPVFFQFYLDLRQESYFMDQFLVEPKSYLSIIILPFQIFGVPINPTFLINFHKIFSLLLVVFFYILLRNFLTVSFAFVASSYILFNTLFLYNSVSIEPLIISQFFIICFFYSLFLFFKKKNEKYLNYLILFYILSVSAQFELSLFLGIPALYVFLFISENKKEISIYKKLVNKKILMFVLFFLFSLPIFNIYYLGKYDPYFRDSNEKNILVEIFKNFYNNIIIENQIFRLNYISITFFIVLSFSISFILILTLLNKKLEIHNPRVSTSFFLIWLFFLCLYFLIYFFGVACFHKFGFTSFKYRFSVYSVEVIILFSISYLIYSFFKSEEKVVFRKYFFLGISIIIYFLLLIYLFNKGFMNININIDENSLNYWKEYLIIKSNVNLSKSCYILKERFGIYVLDFYYGIMNNSKIFSNLLLELPQELNNSRSCYYLYYGYLPQNAFTNLKLYFPNITFVKEIVEKNNCRIDEIFLHYLANQTLNLYFINCTEKSR